jgi:hypothetical protein
MPLIEIGMALNMSELRGFYLTNTKTKRVIINNLKTKTMGLDMYLTKRIYIGANYEHNNVKAKIDISINGNPVKVNPKKITSILEDAMYWRKANAIHQWFVKNIQEGVDNCGEYYVPTEKLAELQKDCERAAKMRSEVFSARVLPPIAGFFFGNTDMDDYYYDEMDRTAKELKKLLKEEGDYYYHSSW